MHYFHEHHKCVCVSISFRDANSECKDRDITAGRSNRDSLLDQVHSTAAVAHSPIVTKWLPIGGVWRDVAYARKKNLMTFSSSLVCNLNLRCDKKGIKNSKTSALIWIKGMTSPSVYLWKTFSGKTSADYRIFESFRFAVSLQGISRMCSDFIFLRWLKVPYIPI